MIFDKGSIENPPGVFTGGALGLARLFKLGGKETHRKVLGWKEGVSLLPYALLRAKESVFEHLLFRRLDTKQEFYE